MNKFMGVKNERALSLFSGAIAGGFAGFISNPFEAVTVGLMQKNKGFRSVVSQHYKKFGLAGFFRGSFARAAYYIPQGAITWFVYSWMKGFYSKFCEKKK